jgi:hypothetical protein
VCQTIVKEPQNEVWLVKFLKWWEDKWATETENENWHNLAPVDNKFHTTNLFYSNEYDNFRMNTGMVDMAPLIIWLLYFALMMNFRVFE